MLQRSQLFVKHLTYFYLFLKKMCYKTVYKWKQKTPGFRKKIYGLYVSHSGLFQMASLIVLFKNSMINSKFFNISKFYIFWYEHFFLFSFYYSNNKFKLPSSVLTGNWSWNWTELVLILIPTNHPTELGTAQPPLSFFYSRSQFHQEIGNIGEQCISIVMNEQYKYQLLELYENVTKAVQFWKTSHWGQGITNFNLELPTS